jgi:hypothetical protein
VSPCFAGRYCLRAHNPSSSFASNVTQAVHSFHGIAAVGVAMLSHFGCWRSDGKMALARLWRGKTVALSMLDEVVGALNSAATELQKTEFRRPREGQAENRRGQDTAK